MKNLNNDSLNFDIFINKFWGTVTAAADRSHLAIISLPSLPKFQQRLLQNLNLGGNNTNTETQNFQRCFR